MTGSNASRVSSSRPGGFSGMTVSHVRCLSALVVAAAVCMVGLMAVRAHAGEVADVVFSHDYVMDHQDGYGCSLARLDDSEMSDVVASGFSRFDLDTTTGLARVYLNIDSKSFVEVDSLKMGYYNSGWDQDWTNVSFGTSAEADGLLVCRGLFIEARFANISDPAVRTLESIMIGTPSMTGPIRATFNSFSGHIENPTDGVLVDGYRLNLGTRTIQSTDSEFYIKLSTTGTPTGWWVYWNNATIN